MEDVHARVVKVWPTKGPLAGACVQAWVLGRDFVRFSRDRDNNVDVSYWHRNVDQYSRTACKRVWHAIIGVTDTSDDDTGDDSDSSDSSDASCGTTHDDDLDDDLLAARVLQFLETPDDACTCHTCADFAARVARLEEVLWYQDFEEATQRLRAVADKDKEFLFDFDFPFDFATHPRRSLVGRRFVQ